MSISKAERDKIAEALIATGAYSDLDQPAILTSGELGIYYVNTEKLLGDKGEWEKYGDDAGAMLRHAAKQMRENGHFRNVVDITAEHAWTKLKERDGNKELYAISGGQRRDWIFSGPVALRLSLPHVSLYKDGEADKKVDVHITYQDFSSRENLAGIRVLHVVDLITEGSSVHTCTEQGSRGWVPMLRKRGAFVNDLVAIVSRRQGGEEMLAKQDVEVTSFVSVDSDFLRDNSKDPVRAVAYAQDPNAWSREYLASHGALHLVGYFNKGGAKLGRATKFLERYGQTLREADKYAELHEAVNRTHGLDIDTLVIGP